MQVPFHELTILGLNFFLNARIFLHNLQKTFYYIYEYLHHVLLMYSMSCTHKSQLLVWNIDFVRLRFNSSFENEKFDQNSYRKYGILAKVLFAKFVYGYSNKEIKNQEGRKEEQENGKSLD